MLAVERLAHKAVFGEAPEDLLFTLADLDRAVNFSARTTGGCTSELAASHLPFITDPHELTALLLEIAA